MALDIDSENHDVPHVHKFRAMHRRAQRAEREAASAKRQLRRWERELRDHFDVTHKKDNVNNRYDATWAVSRIRWTECQLATAKRSLLEKLLWRLNHAYWTVRIRVRIFIWKHFKAPQKKA